MSTTTTGRVWVAFGPVGAVGAVHQIGSSYAYRLMDDDYHGMYTTLEAAKSALHAAMKPGAERPEFREH